MQEADFTLMTEELRSESDRATVLVYGAIIDEAIENALIRRMVQLTATERDQIFQGLGPLSSFSAKINIAYAVNIFGKMTKRDLHYIREVRNAFAHVGRNLRFSTKKCLTFVRRCISQIMFRGYQQTQKMSKYQFRFTRREINQTLGRDTKLHVRSSA
jgi:hypothetical protein